MAPSSNVFVNDAIAMLLRSSQAVSDRIQATVTHTREQVTTLTQDASERIQATVDSTRQQVATTVYRAVDHSSGMVGNAISPIVDHPWVQAATKIPGISWLLAAVGQVNHDRVQREVEELYRQYPADTPEQLAQRVIQETAMRAAAVGLATNFIPPLALSLIAIDLGAIAALQAEMIYRIAAIYGFSPADPTRRGEVVTVWAVFTGSSELVKLGLSAAELLPGVGAAIGAASDATLVYTIGNLACLFYQEKCKLEPITSLQVA